MSDRDAITRAIWLAILFVAICVVVGVAFAYGVGA